jgi:hypothetical protein
MVEATFELMIAQQTVKACTRLYFMQPAGRREVYKNGAVRVPFGDPLSNAAGSFLNF